MLSPSQAGGTATQQRTWLSSLHSQHSLIVTSSINRTSKGTDACVRQFSCRRLASTVLVNPELGLRISFGGVCKCQQVCQGHMALAQHRRDQLIMSKFCQNCICNDVVHDIIGALVIDDGWRYLHQSMLHGQYCTASLSPISLEHTIHAKNLAD